MTHPAVGPAETVELTIALPRPLFDEVVAYAELRGGDVGWTLRRGARFLLDGEAEQEGRLAVMGKRRK